MIEPGYGWFACRSSRNAPSKLRAQAEELYKQETPSSKGLVPDLLYQ